MIDLRRASLWRACIQHLSKVVGVSWHVLSSVLGAQTLAHGRLLQVLETAVARIESSWPRRLKRHAHRPRILVLRILIGSFAHGTDVLIEKEQNIASLLLILLLHLGAIVDTWKDFLAHKWDPNLNFKPFKSWQL